ncbi:MAG: hypothetical protein Q8O55_03935 [Dehalococcoidales bacterium]|nr:hypothetical protein [Dehalococcoidales bacterium]
MEYELKVLRGEKQIVRTWDGADGLTAARRYADAYPGDLVLAWRDVPYGIFPGDTSRIVEPGSLQK